jgi:hypothetical protein
MNTILREYDLGYFNNSNNRIKLPKREIINRIKAWELNEIYYDGNRDNGYGGFYDDGRWNNLVIKLIERYSINQKARIVDLGCKKGFILKAFRKYSKNYDLIGIENHNYPINKSDEEIRSNIQFGNLYEIPCETNSVDFLISFSALYMQTLGDVVKSLKEIMRVSSGRSYITLGAYNDEIDKKIFMDWTLIGTTILSIEEWKIVLSYSGYTGDVFFTTPKVLGLMNEK